MKKTKIIIPALGVLLLSTAASVSGTVAWFSMNNFVTATGMNIKAKAENGIIINNGVNSVWNESATAAHNAALEVLPTSTYDATTWAHGSSSNSDQATTDQATNTTVKYSMLTLAWDHALTNNVLSGTGAGYVESNNDGQYNPSDVAGVDANDDGDYTDEGDTAPISAENAYYLKNSFFIKSSSEAVTKNVFVTNVKVSGETTSVELNKALRVLIKSSSTVKIYAPFTGATLTYDVCKAVSNDTPTYQHDVTAISAATTNGVVNTNFFGNTTTIPAYSTNSPLQFDIYLYFEGEDAACKSTNLNVASLDTLAVEVVFGTEQVANS